MAEKKPPKPPSEEFTEAFAEGSGGLIVECDFCGRVYFGTGGDYEKGERERYEELAKKEPDKYIAVEDFTSRIGVDGKTYAYGCECNFIRNHEDWVWAHRYQIGEYLRKRAWKKANKASEDLSNAEGIPFGNTA